MITDDEILKAYMKGWEDENDIYLKEILPYQYVERILNIAYSHGRTDFLLGDDLSSVDLQSETEILTAIKTFKNYG